LKQGVWCVSKEFYEDAKYQKDLSRNCFERLRTNEVVVSFRLCDDHNRDGWGVFIGKVTFLLHISRCFDDNRRNVPTVEYKRSNSKTQQQATTIFCQLSFDDIK
jgi:hypothetical protein